MHSSEYSWKRGLDYSKTIEMMMMRMTKMKIEMIISFLAHPTLSTSA